MERFKIVPAVLCIILKDNKVLMMLRKNKFDAGTYSIVGGCMEDAETVRQAAIREVKEETNLDIQEEDIEIVSNLHRVVVEDEKNKGWQSSEYVCVIKIFSGEPKIMEEDKCSDLQWFELNNLPKNISKYAKRAIDNYINKEYFSEISY